MAIRKTIKTLLALLLAGLLLEGGGYLYGLQPSDIYYYHYLYRKEKSIVEDKYSLEIKKELSNTEHPKEWSKNNLTDISITKNKYDYARALRLLKKETSKYPGKIIKENLNTIYYLDRLIINGIPAGGTYNIEKNSLYLLNKHNKVGLRTSKPFLSKIFHHELSSILMHSYNFDEIKWRSVFEKSFLYENEKDPFYYAIYMQGNADKINEKELYSRGLLKQYAETGVENDFNTYAEAIFTEPRKMKKLIEEYPIIKRKYETFKAFYLSIDPGFAPVFEKIDG